jgi:hypothetical protein
MTICNPKMHIICGACGCNTMIEFHESTLYCRNCSFVVSLSEVLPERAPKQKESLPPSHNTGNTGETPQICAHCSNVVTVEGIGGWLDRGYKLCPYCGRKLRVA